MSGDEFFALFPSLLLVLGTWVSWLRTGATLETYHRSKQNHLLLWATSLGAAGILLGILQTWASWDVRDSWFYTAFYMFIGAAVVGCAMLLMDRVGLSVRDDVLERGNPAAGIAAAGAIVGHTLAFAGANIGDGPGWWVVLFCAGLANGSLLISWIALDRFARMSDAITIMRSHDAAWRTAGWFVAGGLIFGRGAAGNWQNVESAIIDFINVGVGGIILFACVLVLEVFVRPSTDSRHAISRGIMPAAAYLCGAIIYVTTRHPW